MAAVIVSSGRKLGSCPLLVMKVLTWLRASENGEAIRERKD